MKKESLTTQPEKKGLEATLLGSGPNPEPMAFLNTMSEIAGINPKSIDKMYNDSKRVVSDICSSHYRGLRDSVLSKYCSLSAIVYR